MLRVFAFPIKVFVISMNGLILNMEWKIPNGEHSKGLNLIFVDKSVSQKLYSTLYNDNFFLNGLGFTE